MNLIVEMLLMNGSTIRSPILYVKVILVLMNRFPRRPTCIGGISLSALAEGTIQLTSPTVDEFHWFD